MRHSSVAPIQVQQHNSRYMAFADINLRDNGSSVFDISLSGGAGPTGNRNFFMFFDDAFVAALIVVGVVYFQ